MSLLIVSCSLHPASRSRQLVQFLREHYAHEKHSCQFVDLAEVKLPLCDGDSASHHPEVESLSKKVKEAEAIIMAVPIYNFGISAAAKNFVELVGEQLEGKVFGFICAAGGQKSFMSVMSLANSLMLDFRCLIVPKFVYVDESLLTENEQEIHNRLHELLNTVVSLKNAWKACR